MTKGSPRPGGAPGLGLKGAKVLGLKGAKLLGLTHHAWMEVHPHMGPEATLP